jgi:hypothetical protein
MCVHKLKLLPLQDLWRIQSPFLWLPFLLSCNCGSKGIHVMGPPSSEMYSIYFVRHTHARKANTKQCLISYTLDLHDLKSYV